MRMTEQEYQEFMKRTGKLSARRDRSKKQSKYNSKHTRVDGIIFDSQIEAEYYGNLKLLQRAKAIKGFCIQPKFILEEGNESERAIIYSADFIVFKDDGTFEIVDVKGFESQQWRKTFKQFRLRYPELVLKVEKG